MKKTPQTVESMKAASAILRVPMAVLKKAKADGCPAFRASNRIHLPTLRSWLKLHPMSAGITPVKLEPLTPQQLEELGTIEISLANAIRDEIETGRLLQRARETGDSSAVADLTAAVGRARKNRMAAEKEVTRLKFERGKLVPVEAHVAELNRTWTPIISALRQLPRKAALNFDSATGVHVEKICDTLVEEAIANGRKSLGISTGDELNLAASALLRLICEEKTISPSALVNVDSLRQFIVAEIQKTAAV